MAKRGTTKVEHKFYAIRYGERRLGHVGIHQFEELTHINQHLRTLNQPLARDLSDGFRIKSFEVTRNNQGKPVFILLLERRRKLK